MYHSKTREKCKEVTDTTCKKVNPGENEKKPQDDSCAGSLESNRSKLEPRKIRKIQQALKKKCIDSLQNWYN